MPTNFDAIIPNRGSNLLQNANKIEKFFSYTTYILGKLSIGYGIFEVIQAFRKLNSKG